MLYIILVVFICFLVVFTVITQIMLPIYYDRKIFPMFNKTKQTLEKQLVEINDINDTQELISQVKQHLNTLNHKGNIDNE